LKNKNADKVRGEHLCKTSVPIIANINIAYLSVLAHLENLSCHLITYLITLFYVIFGKYKTFFIL